MEFTYLCKSCFLNVNKITVVKLNNDRKKAKPFWSPSHAKIQCFCISVTLHCKCKLNVSIWKLHLKFIGAVDRFMFWPSSPLLS